MCASCSSHVSRRSFVTSASALALALFVPRHALARSSSGTDYDLWLQRSDTGEQIIQPFTLDSKSVYNPGYYRLCSALRDNHVAPSQGNVYISIRLIETLWAVQQVLAQQGVRAPIVVHSGYRTPETNARTEGAAYNSLHMYGMAVDFDVPGVGIGDLADICWSCPGAGGVGSYAGGWVHLDTGSHRFWEG